MALTATLDGRQQRLLENARLALERGEPDYAIAACGEILAAAPGCVAARRMQRAAQLRRAGGENGLGRVLRGTTGPWARLTMPRTSPAARLSWAEQRLAADPRDVAALRVLGEAARALEMPETAEFAFEEIRVLRPADRENLLALGAVRMALGRPAEALELADEVLSRAPGDPEGLDLMRRAAIAQTITQGGWETPGSFREKRKGLAK